MATGSLKHTAHTDDHPLFHFTQIGFIQIKLRFPAFASWNIHLLLSSCRCEKPGELSPGRKRPGAGQRGAPGLRHVQLPSANGQVRPAAPPAAGDPSDQPAGRGVPLLQTPERRRALQQPAYWNAARQESLRGGRRADIWAALLQSKSCE